MTPKTQAGDVGRSENLALARLLDETAQLLEEQRANPFRVRAYREAAAEIRRLKRSLRSVWEEDHHEGLLHIPHVGESLSRAIETWLATGSLGILARLKGDQAAEEILRSVGGIGRELAHRIHHDLHISSLEELELAAYDGRLVGLARLGPRRVHAIRDQLATRLRFSRHGRERRQRRGAPPGEIPTAPPVTELLDVDCEYRDAVAQNRLARIAPRRFNPLREAWLPVLHTHRGDRHYTALYSNTARAHELGRTRDWVVIYLDDGTHEQQWTVVTERRGGLRGKRVVRGREPECGREYGGDGFSGGVTSGR